MHVYKARIEREGLEPATLGWPELRSFIDVLLDAVASFDGPRPDQVSLSDIRRGSVTAVLQVSGPMTRSFELLRRGPSKAWSREQRRRVEPLYQFARRNQVEMSVGARVLRPVIIPDETRTWILREWGELTGKVMRVGGNEGRVRLDVEGEGPFICDAGEDAAKEVAHHLYERVVVSGDITRDVQTFALVRMTIHQVRGAPQRLPASEVFARIDAIVGNSLDGFDVLGAARAERA